MKSHRRKNTLLRITFLMTAFFVCFSCCANLCAAAEESSSLPIVRLNSALLDGELPTVVRGFEYKEFKMNKSAENIVFMSDYRPVNLLSNKEILPKTSFLQNSKFGYNNETPKKHWGLVTTIY